MYNTSYFVQIDIDFLKIVFRSRNAKQGLRFGSCTLIQQGRTRGLPNSNKPKYLDLENAKASVLSVTHLCGFDHLYYLDDTPTVHSINGHTLLLIKRMRLVQETSLRGTEDDLPTKRRLLIFERKFKYEISTRKLSETINIYNYSLSLRLHGRVDPSCGDQPHITCRLPNEESSRARGVFHPSPRHHINPDFACLALKGRLDLSCTAF
jgi:hypothetical protein